MFGGPDPANGGIIFSDQDDPIREDEYGIWHDFTGYPSEFREYFDSSYGKHPGLGYALSQPFINPATGLYTVVSTASEVCGAVGNCGSIASYGPRRDKNYLLTLGEIIPPP